VTHSQCPNCGAAVSLADDVIADQCVFCTSPLVAGTAGSDHADLVAPFALDQRAASERLSSYLQGQWLAPGSIRESRSPEKLAGVLVPFWAHDASVRSSWDAMIGVHWYRTETYLVTVTRNGRTTTETRTRRVQETEWFPTQGTHATSYTGHLVSGSKGLPESEANALEPFDLGSALPYSPALLAGWTAERATIPRSSAASVAQSELERATRPRVQRFLPGDVTRALSVQSHIEVRDVRLVMLPVWIATYTWDDEVHRLLVNGQTGEVVGKVPKAWLKIGGLVVAALLGSLLFVAFLLLMAGVSQ